MNIDIVNQKIDDLRFRVSLDQKGLENAQYNLKFAKRLRLDGNQINEFTEKLDYYTDKYNSDVNTLKVFEEYKDNYEKGINDNAKANDYYFKCTLPYEKVDSFSNYQTSFIANEDVAKLFANGVSYKEIINCLDTEDILNIESHYKSVIPEDYANLTNVDVEVIEQDKVSFSNEKPIIAFNGKKFGLIASGEILVCYFDGGCYKKLDGKPYSPQTPTIDEVCSDKTITMNKQLKYDKMLNIEYAVKSKIDTNLSQINTKIFNKGTKR